MRSSTSRSQHNSGGFYWKEAEARMSSMRCCSQAEAELVGLSGRAVILEQGGCTWKILLDKLPTPLQRVQQLEMQRCFSVPYSGPAEELGDSPFQGKVWVQARLTLTQFTKSQWNIFSPDMKNRKQQNYKLGEMKTNNCIEIPIPRQKEKKIHKHFLLLPSISQICRAGACSFYYFIVTLLENHSWLPQVWDIAELDLEYFTVMRITITNLWGTLYAAQVCFGLQTSESEFVFWFWCFNLSFSGTYPIVPSTAIPIAIIELLL